MNFTFSFLEEQIKHSRKPLILTHVDPDGDALGSVMAMRSLIEEAGVKPYVSLVGKFNSGLKVSEKDYLASKVDLTEYDLIIILDTNSLVRADAETVLINSIRTPVFIIDHHLKKEGHTFPKNFHLLINPDATATCEIIYDLLEKEKKTISNTVASYLFLGIYTDSGGFFHSNTTPKLLRKVKKLLKKGVLFKNITRSAFKGKNVHVLNFWGEKISNAVYNPRLKFIFSKINQKELDQKSITHEEVGGLANLLNMSQEALFSLLLTDTDEGKVKGSLRSSERKGFNVNTVSRVMGGGGHRLAAGFELAGKIVDKGKNFYVKQV